MIHYLPIITMLVLATLFAALSFVASALLGPKRPTQAKEAPYECGIVPSREPAERFPVRFYLVAMIFIIFDIEIIFLYPWAVIFRRDLNTFGLVEMMVSALIIFVPFAYFIASGALDWGPINRLRSVAGQGRVDALAHRGTEGSIRRVGSGVADPASSDSHEAA